MYCSCVHSSMVGGAMLCFVESMCYCNFSVLTTFVYSCHTSLTVMPLSVYVYFECCNVCSL